MRSLLSAEWYKLIHSKSSRVVFIGTSIIAALMAWLPFILEQIGFIEGRNKNPGQESLSIIGGLSTFFLIWFIAFVGFFVAAEFQNGAARNTLSLGKNRITMFFSKFCASLIMLFLTFLAVALISVVSLSIINGFGDMGLAEFLGHFAFNLFVQVYFHLPYVAIICMLAFITRNTGLTIIFGIGYMIVIAIAMQVVGIFPDLPHLIELFPDYYIATFGNLSEDGSFITNGIIVSSIYTAAACIIGCAIFVKTDMK